MTDVPVLNALIFAVPRHRPLCRGVRRACQSRALRVWKEIVEERNVAAAILAGAVALGICWIIATTMH